MTRTNKRHTNVHIILTAEDRMRFAQFINILIAIDKRTNIVKKRPKQKKKRNVDYGSQLLRAMLLLMTDAGTNVYTTAKALTPWLTPSFYYSLQMHIK